MGPLRTTVGVENLAQRGGLRELPETMVDTESEFTWIPRPVLESVGIRPERRQRFIVAGGRYVERDLGFATMSCSPRREISSCSGGGRWTD